MKTLTLTDQTTATRLPFLVLMVCGTHFVLGGGWSMTALVAVAAVGRRHLIIVHGVRAGVRTYGLLLILTYLTVIVGVVLLTPVLTAVGMFVV